MALDFQSMLVVVAAMLIAISNGFSIPSSSARTSPLFRMSSSTVDDEVLKEGGSANSLSGLGIGELVGVNYQPKWKKKETLADLTGTADISAQDKGLIGGVPITFQQGKGDKATFIETSALPGQPLKLVASQAGQYIKYGCGKGECGTCESLCNGKYLRPCVDVVPTDLEMDEDGKYPQLVIMVKGTKAKVVSSGKFFSIKSFLLGFWNNLLGMMGFVRDRRKAKENWQERMDKEAEIKRITEEKKMRRAIEAAMKNGAQPQ